MNFRLLCLLVGHGDGALAESVAEPPAHFAQVPHAAGAGGLASAGLDGPVVLADLGCGVAARGANLLLDVETDLSASTAQSVRLVASLTKRTGSLRLESIKNTIKSTDQKLTSFISNSF